MKSSAMQQTPRPTGIELISVKKRIIIGSLVLAAVAVLAVPSAVASAASPWWQVLTGSRPTNLWEPENNVQEIQAGPGVTIISLEGTNVACMLSPVCTLLGLPKSETAQQLQEALEAPGAYGPGNIEVKEDPESSRRFVVTSIGEDAGRPVPPLGAIGPEAKAKVLRDGGSGRLVLTLTNLGDAPINGTIPVKIIDKMPEDVIAQKVEGFAGFQNKSGPELHCSVESPAEVACIFEGELSPFEAIEIEVFASLLGSPPAAGAPGAVTVSGGGAAMVTTAQPVRVSPEPVRFGFEQFSAVAEEEGGGPASLAGSHPFQFTTTLQLNAGRVTPGNRLNEKVVVEQPALPRNVRFPLPVGLVGNATVAPTCPVEIFVKPIEFTNACPDNTVVGVSSVTVVETNALGLLREAIPVFNLPPSQGEPARFGFMAGGVPVFIDTSVDPDNQYRIVASVQNVPQVARFLSSTTTLWGAPGDPRHDNARGWACVYGGEVPRPCERPQGLREAAFLRQPVSCVTPFDFNAEIEPWNTPLGSDVDTAESSGGKMEACSHVPFNPSIGASPTSRSSDGSSGLAFRLDMPNAGLLSKEAISEGQAKKVEVTLPDGVTINPSQAEGLGACSPTQYAQEKFDSAPGAGCPQSSKIGSVDVTTPLLDEEAHGSVYVAKPYDNPFDSLLALYMVAKIPSRGILVKQAGQVKLDPSTGQIVTTFDDLPQIPFETFKLNFFGGNRAPLVLPPKCGSYDIVARFTPWHALDPDNPLPSEVVTKTSSFTVDQGPNGSPCPSGTPPFKPGFVAGTENNAAGSYSPFIARLTRNDGEQEFSRFSMKLPKGVIGKLAGVPFCSDAAIVAARARTGPHGGQEELDSPSCPSASQIGRTSVGAGVGPSLTYAPGRIYLAGPYQGSKLSIVAITTATVGPFDLGTVVIRQALRVDPETAEVTADGSSSDPIPHILQGIVTHARDIRIYVDRSKFVLNPTSCERMTADASVFGTGLDFGSSADDQSVDVSSPFQAADCASLGFKPKLKLTLSGGTKRTDTPKLKAVLTARKGDANIGRAQVTLPHSAFLEQSHIRTICTRVQFKAGAGNGAQCPKASIYGRAKAISPLLDEPLVGPVFLRSSNHELPDLVAALHSKKVDIDLVGRIDSLDGRIRNTFDAVPDAPVTKFVLEMQGGQKGLIVNSTDICRGKHRAIADFTGQNGRRHLFKPVVHAKCPGKRR